MDKVVWWVTAPRDDQGELDESKCACCGPLCCMYPANALGYGVYGSSDLPDSIVINGVTFARNGVSYGDTVNGIIFEGDYVSKSPLGTWFWARYKNGIRSLQECLIASGITDQFRASYTLLRNLSNPPSTVTLIRTGLCTWEGTQEFYEPPDPPFVPGGTLCVSWGLSYDAGTYWSIFNSFSQFNEPCQSPFSYKLPVEKNGTQSSPVGTWGGDSFEIY